MSLYNKPLLCGQTSYQRQRGSALLTALIFAVIIGIAAVSYLKLAASEYRSSVRATLYSSSLNLAESGVEMGIEALTAGQTTGSTWKKSVSNYLQEGGFTGDVTLVILNASADNPTIYAEGVIKGHPAGDVRKQVRVELSSGFSPYRYGFTAKKGMSFSGNGVVFDSYNSRYGEYNTSLPVIYWDADGIIQNVPTGYGTGGKNKNDDIYVASDNISNSSTTINQGNANVYGYTSTTDISYVSIGPNGVVTDYDDGSHDPTRVLDDFDANFPDQPHPTASDTFTTTVKEFVKVKGKLTEVETTKSYPSISEDVTITGGTAASPATYAMSQISGGEITIDGHVVLVMSGDIKLSGQSGIKITSGSSLTIYTQDDVSIAGQGVANADGIPSSFYLYGTATTGTANDGTPTAGQTIKISGNGQLASTVYAPAADLELKGGGNSGEVMGGVVAFTAKVTGGSSFHFDEALREINEGGGVYSIDSWLEMTSATVASTPKDLSSY